MRSIMTDSFKRTKYRRVVEEEVTAGTYGPIKTHTHRSVADGEEVVTFDVQLNTPLVFQMAERAARSKGGQCKDGALVVKITARRKV